MLTSLMISHKLLQRVIYIYKRRKAISISLIEIKEGLLQFVLEALSSVYSKTFAKNGVIQIFLNGWFAQKS